MRKFCLPLLFTLAAWLPSIAQSSWPPVSNTARPWTRWWWMGSAVNAKDLSENLTQYARAGLGGVEIVPIYGARGYEASYIPYLSPKWMQMLDTATAIATSLGLGVDMAVGSGWPIGGPQVTIEDAATKLHIQQYKLAAGQSLRESIQINDPKQQTTEGTKLQALIAYGSQGEIIDITHKVNPSHQLDWTAGNGDWTLYAAFSTKTFQKVKRAAPGGEGYTFDHFSATALQNYFRKYDTAYKKRVPAIRSYFNDSYELFGANWSPAFFQEFEKRRGYDLKRYLREFDSMDSSELVSRIKADYRETMAELILENFSTRFRDWAHHRNALSTNQAHGSPGNLLDLYAAVDIAETETFGSSSFAMPGLRRDSAGIQEVDPDPVMMKFPSSAAHAVGHKLVSCESFTWLTEHFKTSWAQCKPEVEKIFLSGINHVFLHGTTYSPAAAAWPGWLFYASVNFVPANSMWPHLKALSQYITRCQSVLQAGQPDNDIMLYWPVYDQWQQPKGKDKPFRIHNVHDWLQPTRFYELATSLQQQGFTLDYVSDKMIRQTQADKNGLQVADSGASYKTIVVPACRLMKLETMQHLNKLAAAGATIIFEELPTDVPGLHQYGERKSLLLNLINSYKFENRSAFYQEASMGRGKIILTTNMASALIATGTKPEELSKHGLGFIRRKDQDAHWYYIVNHTAREIDSSVTLQRNNGFYWLLDPQTGREGSISVTGNSKEIRLQLKPGEAVFIKTSAPLTRGKAWEYRRIYADSLLLQNNWQVSFTAGGPTVPPSVKVADLSSWTEWNDSTLKDFSGTAVYQSSFLLPKKTSKKYMLNLGDVRESARVWINGKEAGTAWSLPYELEVGAFIKQGINSIKIEVVNLMANRIAYMDRNKIAWRNYHEINFVNTRYKNFDASAWNPQPSGLLGPVVIRY